MWTLRKILVLSVVLAMCACSARSQPSSSEEDEDAVLAPDFAARSSVCIQSWSSVIEAWKAAGGGIGESLLVTRHQIANDSKSVFAAMVREAWAKQKYDTDSASFGAWPIEDERFRSVGTTLRASESSGIPERCDTFAWPAGLLAQEISTPANAIVPVRRLIEVPKTMTWQAPDAKNWLIYWLLVRVDR